MNTYNLPPFIASIANLALGTLVVSKNPRAQINRAFGLLCLFLGVWNFGIFMMWDVSDPATAALWSICLHAGLVFIPPAFLHFVLRLTKRRSPLPWLMCAFGYGAGLFFTVQSIRGKFTQGVQYLAWGWMPVSGPTSRWFDYLFIALIGLGVYYLLLAYLQAGPRVERNRFSYVLVAVVVAVMGSIPNFLLVRRIAAIYPAGHLVTVVSTAIFAYVIISYRLLDVGLALRRGLVLSGMTGFLVGAYVVLLLALVRIAEGKQTDLPFFWLALLALAMVLALRPVIQRLQGLVERKFFREHYEGQRILRELGSSVVGLMDLEPLLAHAVKQVGTALQTVKAQVFLHDPSSDGYTLRSSLNAHSQGQLTPDDPLLRVMSAATSPLVRDEILQRVEVERASNQDRAELLAARRRLQELDAQVCVPLRGKERLQGFLNVGSKKGGGLFSPEDIYLLTALGNQLAVAIENASLYEELKATYDRLTHTQAQLYQAEKLATLGELAAGVAHEINNPLGSVMLASQIMARQLQGKGIESKHLKIIEENVLRCKAIVSALLDFARQKEPRMVPTDIRQVLSNSIALAASHEAVRGTTILQDFPPNLPFILADANQLAQVFLNLIVNGAIASQPGGQIQIKATVADGTIAIRFHDNGHGIPSEIIGKIFDPFFSTRKDNKGTGLGLSISYGIVRRHGGSIEVESEVGTGSVFTVELPLGEQRKADQTNQVLYELIATPE